jgi:hypothetical protein
MFMTRTPTRCLAAAAALVSFNAMAVGVDFEDLSPGSGGLYMSSTSVVSQGFNVGHSGSFAVVYGNVLQGATDFSGNGTNRLVSFNTSTITLTPVGGGAFDLSAFEGGESWVIPPHTWATQIQVVGYYVSSGTTTQVFDLDLVKSPLAGMQTFVMNASFTGLSKVEFSGIGGNPEFSIDNVRVTGVVPEPQTVALLAAGLALVAGAARRRAASPQG